MKKQNLNSIGVELTDEELLTMTGGDSFLTVSDTAWSGGVVYPLYGITPQPLYGIIPTPKYGVQPLYGILPMYGVQPLYGIIPGK